MEFSNSYAELGDRYYQRIAPGRVSDPRLFLWNADLARQLAIPSELADDELAQIFGGNRILPGADPIALAYAGHQFGHFVPQLGDGRAHLLGEVINRDGQRRDIQLKGSGPTQFSRGGDGRCALGPAIREFVMSEAMNALGIPTTRSLAVVTTGEAVYRKRGLPGAVVTRIASSHLRVGTFQFFAARGDERALARLGDYTIERHYPDLNGAGRYLALLDRVIESTIRLVVEWIRVGFIHGVMNTDNTALSGETIDYGPCAMIGVYNPATVYSSIDRRGRYAFGNQPRIAQWNMARFAECLLPLIDSDQTRAIEQVEPLIAGFPKRFEQARWAMLGRKLGLREVGPDDQALISSLLEQLQEDELDYTITFHRLTRSLHSEAPQLRAELDGWYERWHTRLTQHSSIEEAAELMQRHNPVLIPRNHHVEAVIDACVNSGDPESATQFLQALRSPYHELPLTSRYQDAPRDLDADYQTFCGT